MLKAVIYDLDGTLIDSRADLARSVDAMLSVLALPRLPDERVVSFVGGGAELLVRRALAAARGAGERNSELPPELVAQGLRAWHAHYTLHLLDQTRPYPGIAELLHVPPRARAVLTNKPGGYARRILDGLGLSAAFAQVLGGDEVARKPDPRGLLQICAGLSVSAREALLVGDSPIDIETGRAAGIPVCAVSWGFSPRAELEQKHPAHLLDDARALASLLVQLGGAD